MKIFSIKDIQISAYLSKIQSFLASAIGGNNSINKNSVFGQLLTIISAIAHNIMLYIEDSLVEQNKYTAQRKKSLYGLAALSGYNPSSGRAAGVWLKIAYKPNNQSSLDIVIPNHQRLVCSQNGLYYNLVLGTTATTIRGSAGLGKTNIYAVEGRFETQRFAVSGGKLYAQNLKYTGYIDTEYIEVNVNDELATRYESLYDMIPGEISYYVQFNPISGIDLIFGNGKYGAELQEGDVLEITYLLHDGEAGNLEIDSETYFSFMDTLKDIGGNEVDGNEVFEVGFATDDSVASGSNQESLFQIRHMIGFNSRALVLADSNNYKNFINKFSFCGYNRTWTENGSMVTKSLIMRNYRLLMEDGSDYFNLSEENFVLSDSQKESIQNALENSGQMLAGSIFDIIDVTLCKYACFIYIKLKSDSADQTLITEQIRELVGEFFGDIESDYYIPKSDITQLIKDNIDDIDGINCYFLSQRNEEAIQNLEYESITTTFDASTGTYRKTTKTISLLPDENPNLGLDVHGNISLDSDEQFPVLMGGWYWTNSESQKIYVSDPLIINYE